MEENEKRGEVLVTNGEPFENVLQDKLKSKIKVRKLCFFTKNNTPETVINR